MAPTPKKGTRNPVTSRSRTAPTTDAVISALARLGIAHDYPKNVVIITEGDDSDAVYVVLAGTLQMYLSGPRGKRVVLGVLGAGEFVGEMEIDRQPRSISVVTLQTSRLALLSGEQFRSFMFAMPSAASRLAHTLARRARTATEAVRSLALSDAPARVCRLLETLAESGDRGAGIVRGVTQRVIAEHAGCSREMVSRIFKQLSEQGYIAIDKRHIRLLRALPGTRGDA